MSTAIAGTPPDRAPSLPMSTWVALIGVLALVFGALYNWSRAQGQIDQRMEQQTQEIVELKLDVKDLKATVQRTNYAVMKLTGAVEEQERGRAAREGVPAPRGRSFDR